MQVFFIFFILCVLLKNIVSLYKIYKMAKKQEAINKPKTKKPYYSLRADISKSSEKTIKDTTARLALKGRPYNIVDAVNHIVSEYQRALNGGHVI